jgi:hypothetical protein
MKRYAYKRTYQWSPSIAYSVGLITSDGTLSKDGRHIDLTSTDREQLINFCDAIQKQVPITKKNLKQPIGWKCAFRVQFSDVGYYDFLISAGLMPNKSKILKEIRIPSLYWEHFLRGLFDGDGCITGGYDKRWKSSFSFVLSIASASKAFLETVQANNIRYFGVAGGSISKGKNVYRLAYGKRDTRIISHFMYRHSENLHLKRKREKLEGFLKLHSNGIIIPNARVAELVDASA